MTNWQGESVHDGPLDVVPFHDANDGRLKTMAEHLSTFDTVHTVFTRLGVRFRYLYIFIAIQQAQFAYGIYSRASKASPQQPEFQQDAGIANCIRFGPEIATTYRTKDQRMESQVAEQIENLEHRLQELNSLLMESSKGIKQRNHIEAEIRAVNLRLSHYRELLTDKNAKS